MFAKPFHSGVELLKVCMLRHTGHHSRVKDTVQMDETLLFWAVLTVV